MGMDNPGGNTILGPVGDFNPLTLPNGENVVNGMFAFAANLADRLLGVAGIN